MITNAIISTTMPSSIKLKVISKRLVTLKKYGDILEFIMMTIVTRTTNIHSQRIKKKREENGLLSPIPGILLGLLFINFLLQAMLSQIFEIL
jgi:hypothetical protein